MRILTVRQPWAWAIIHADKDTENRARNVAGDYRGTVAIHAGLKDDPEAYFLAFEWRDWWARNRTPGGQRGHIIGVVDIVDVHHADWCWDGDNIGSTYCSVWGHADAFHLKLSNARPLTTPIRYKGALGLRTLPDDVTAQIMADLAGGTR